MDKQEQYRLGMAAYNAGRYEKAIELLTPLASEGTGIQALLSRFYLGQAHYRLGRRLFQDRRFQDATRHFQRASGANVNGGGIARFLAGCFAAEQQYDLAARELEPRLREEPENVKLRIQLALTQYKMGDPIEAVRTLRAGLYQQPDHAELHYQLGVMLAAEQNYAEAERCFEGALAYQPTNAAAYERLAQICGVTQRHDRAMRYLEKAQELDPWNARIAFQLSLLCQSGPNQDHPSTMMAEAPESLPELDKVAIDRLGQAIIEEPDFVTAFLDLPESEVDREVFSALAATIERALENRPEFADLHFHCGAVYERLGRRVEAIEHTEQAVALNPRYVNALIQLADLYRQTDQWAMGVERLEQAVLAGADYPDIHYMLGQLYQAGGRVDHARKAYRRALDLNRNYKAARQALETLRV